MNTQTEVRAVARALKVIEALNQRTVTSVEELYSDTGIPKPSLVRLLRTLISEGYVFHVSRRDGYTTTEKVVRLSAGFRYQDAIVDIGRPLLEAFTRKHKWQLSLATLDTDAMLIRFNTRHASPFATDIHYLNRRVRILGSSLGRAYLAFCSEDERDILKSILQARSAVSTERGDDAPIDELIEEIRRNGYATIERPPGGRVRNMAVPVISRQTGAAVAAIAVFYFASVMTEAQAACRYLEEMRQIASEIAAALVDMDEMADDLVAG